MRYVMARLEKETEDMIYRIYVTDMLRALTRSIEAPRFAELVYSQFFPEDTRTKEEIVDQISRKLGE